MAQHVEQAEFADEHGGGAVGLALRFAGEGVAEEGGESFRRVGFEDQVEGVCRDLVQAEAEDVGGGAEVDAGDFGTVVVACGEVEVEADPVVDQVGESGGARRAGRAPRGPRPRRVPRRASRGAPRPG
ncbi:hypothetical protein ADK34_27035 [Streptomyces viridochromogenes]|uniref:Uncharacterized protein n=1 Tax=Streptomyces viridochromogenes TaxID=1938 RepID=A0A0L8JPV8_STRVR|nr:hypothetical protein [Streptomyces wedmorensis]KOG15713.1 hypothetical protein ADK34_27035 [Streptomyces viridochromogenes]